MSFSKIERVIPISIPDEVLEDILSRLPAKKLCECKVVSKRWYSIISSRHFVRVTHLERMKEYNMVGFILIQEIGFYPIAYGVCSHGVNKRMLTDGENPVDILGIYNGLICVCNDKDEFFFWNPSTTMYVSIPHSRIVFPKDCKWCSVFFGLGYDECSDDYKLIRVAVFENEHKDTEVQMYSRNNKAWRRMPHFPYEFPLCVMGVFVHENLHWQVSIPDLGYVIATFNIQTETYDVLALPLIAALPTRRGYQLSSVNDEKLVVFSTFSVSFDAFEMWILESYPDINSWTKIVFAPGFDLLDINIVVSIRAFYLYRPGDKQIIFRVDPQGFWVIYEMNSGEYKKLDWPVLGAAFCSIFRFVESLVPPVDCDSAALV